MNQKEVQVVQNEPGLISENSIRKHCEHKRLEIKQFDTLHNLWQVVQNEHFAKSQEKPHKYSSFKHYGLSAEVT